MTLTVSIVEDNAPMSALLASILAKADGFECLNLYADAESAVAELPAQAPDVVLMDIHLPGMDGVECVRRLKPLLPKTQFMMLTVYEDAIHIFDALAAGATGYMVKDTPPRELLAAIREVHRGGSPMAGDIARKVVQSFQTRVETPASNLSPREKEILDLLAEGHLNKEVADRLGISVPTVCTHIRRIYEKLQVRTRAQAVALYRQGPGPIRPR